MPSYFLTEEDAKKAIDMVRPAILAAMKSGQFEDQYHLHIVVMNPAVRPADVNDPDEAILCETTFGDRNDWDANYAEIARTKAFESWKTGLSTHVITELRPYLLGIDDTYYWGSVVLEGVVVAASGLKPWYDEFVSYMVAAALRAIAIDNFQKALKSGNDFLGEEQDKEDGTGDR